MSKGPFLRKYGVATTFNFDLFQVDGIDLRIDAAHAAGDTKIMKNEAAEANTTNAFVDEGQTYSILLTATEMQAARIKVIIVDQTATKVWLDTSFTIETYGHASAAHAFDLDTALVTLAAATHTGAVIPTVTNLTNLPSIPANWLTATGIASNAITAAKIAASALNGKGDWNIGKTGYSLTQAFPTNFSSLSITAGGLIDITQAAADKVWSSTTRTLTAISTAVALSFWNVLEASVVTASTMGLKVKNNLNATISSRQPSGAVDLNTDQSGVTVGTVTTLTNLPAITANWLTATGIASNAIAAAKIAAGALNGKGDWNIGKTGYSLLQAFPSNFADQSITFSTGLVNISQAAADKVWATTTRTITAFGAAFALEVWHVLESAVVTASTIGLKVKTNLDAVLSARTLAAAAYFDPAADTVANVTTVGTLTGHTAQTGDSFARIGAPVGASVIADITAVITRGDIAWLTGAGGSPPQLLHSTTITGLSSQTVFNLTTGAPDDGPYDKMLAIITDAGDATQKAVARILTYTTASNTITLEVDPGIFTMANGDTIDIIAVDPLLAVDIADTPTVAEFDARTILAANYFDPAADTVVNVTNVATLTGHTPQTADHTAAIADIPTVSEFNARTILSGSYFDPATDTVVNVTNVAVLTGHTVQTGDSFARLGAPIGASISADITDIPTVSEFNARTILAANYFDPAADTVVNVTNVATLTGHTVQTGDNFVRLGAPIGASISADLQDIPTVSEFDARTLLAATYFDPTADNVIVGTIDANVIDAASLAVGAVDKIRDGLLPTQNAAFNNIEFLLVAASDHATPVTGATGLAVSRSIDGGTFAAGTGTGPTEVGGAVGIYQYDASAADMNGGIITFRFLATGGTPGAPDDRFLTIITGGGV